MLVLASAGNGGGSPWQYIGTPADGDSVLAVGGVNGAGQYAWFSSTGPSSDGDIKPNVAAVAIAATISDYTGAIVNGGSGTSFACPIVAGSAACLWQAFPNKSNREIFDAIQRSASQALSPDSLLGYGIPNFMVADQLLGGVDMNDAGQDNLVSVYPNPFMNDVEVKFYSSSSQKIAVEVFDVLGKQLFHQNDEAGARITAIINIPLQDLRSGIYFLKITTARNSYLKKVMKY